MGILGEIVEEKRGEIEALRRLRPEADFRRLAAAAPPVRSFSGALAVPGVAIIAEIKRASPSRGRIRDDFDPPAIARAYAAGGARAMSILTDTRFFEGALAHLVEARAAGRLPVLRKDFLIDPIQVWEARAAGADAILLIAAILGDEDLRGLLRLAGELGMDALCEVHDEAEMLRVLDAGGRLIGINNRDLRTFRVDIAVTERLAPLARDRALVVAESGIRDRADIERLEAAGARAFLIGEHLMRAGDPGGELRKLVEGHPCA
ncbi:MAG: indole-3-glycerol phosphate synthase TrpC [Planctomycetes bacterium]|nr:indole-3-glycerol phosphate synthase TrpC [Planctomycetota bacterium]